MKFILVILSLLAVMVAANNEVTKNAELMSARCKGVAKRFVRGWYKVDTNRNGKVTWPEMARFYVKWARSHGKSNAWIKAHGKRVYRHWKKWAGAKNYVYWKQVWNVVRKRSNC